MSMLRRGPSAVGLGAMAGLAIPLMAAIHGSAGALGVAGCGLAGWRLAADR